MTAIPFPHLSTLWKYLESEHVYFASVSSNMHTVLMLNKQICIFKLCDIGDFEDIFVPKMFPG